MAFIVLKVQKKPQKTGRNYFLSEMPSRSVHVLMDKRLSNLTSNINTLANLTAQLRTPIMHPPLSRAKASCI